MIEQYIQLISVGMMSIGLLLAVIKKSEYTLPLAVIFLLLNLIFVNI